MDRQCFSPLGPADKFREGSVSGVELTLGLVALV
jgi:hypothetical protein